MCNNAWKCEISILQSAHVEEHVVRQHLIDLLIDRLFD